MLELKWSVVLLFLPGRAVLLGGIVRLELSTEIFLIWQLQSMSAMLSLLQLVLRVCKQSVPVLQRLLFDA